MSQLTNTPRSETVLRLEARKSFSFALKVVDGNSRPLDLASTELTLSVSDRRGTSTLISKTAVSDGVAAGAGYARFDLQAADLAHPAGEYPYTLALVDEGYSSVLVKGTLEILDNSGDTGMADTYTGGTPATALQATLQGQVIVVQAGHVRPPGEETFTDRDRDKLDGIEKGAEVNVPADWNAGPGTPSYIKNRPLNRLVPPSDAAGKILVSTGAEEGEFRWAVPDEGGRSTLTQAELDKKADRNSFFISVRDYGVRGDGSDETAAFQRALDAGEGRTVYVPPGRYSLAPVYIRSNTTLYLEQGATLVHSRTGSMLMAAGTEATAKTLVSADIAVGARSLTASIPALQPGDLIRLASTRIFDSFSTKMTHGEILTVKEVVGGVIHLETAVAGGPYMVAEKAYVRKITPVENISIIGGGTIEGMKAPAMGQTGIDISLARNVRIAHINSINIDRRHMRLSDVQNGWIDSCYFEWAVDNTQAYGVSMANAIQDSGVTNCTFSYLRHAFTTNNDTAIDGIPRRILVSHNTVNGTSTALGGSMGGGDALDTHAAAEDVWFEYNTVNGSMGQGINMECVSGRIIGNLIRDSVGTGISVHNETDLPGRVRISGNTVLRSGGHGIHVSNSGRGGLVGYESVVVTENDISGTALAGGTGSGIFSRKNTGALFQALVVANNTIRGVKTTYAIWINTAAATRSHLAANFISEGSTAVYNTPGA